MMPSDVKTIVDNLEDFIEVPDGIERLKKAVLTLGISGKLVPQNLTEGTGDDLYNEMTKAVLRSKNKTKIIPTITSEEIPFKIPETWKWVRLGEVTNYGQTEKSDLSNIIPGTWILELEDLEKNGGRLLSMIEYPQRKPGSDKNIFKKGDVLFGKLRPYLNKVIVADRDGIASSELLPIRWNVPAVPEYLRIVLLSDYFFTYVNQKTYGVKMPRLGTDDGKNSLIPLPPLAEQKRIIERFEEVINQIKVLEIKKQERDDIRKRLTRNAMHSLGLGDTKIALENLTDLVKSIDDLKELERSIITLGISGNLVSQNISDGNTEDFYLKIKRDAVARKKKVDVILPDDIKSIPFKIPNTWKWVSLGDVCNFDYGFTDSAKETGSARFVRITDMGVDYRLIEDNQKFIDLNDKSRKSLLKEDDVLVARIGASFGRTIVFKERYPAIFASYLIRITFDKSFLLPEYYWIFAQSNAYWDQALSLVSGSAQPQFNANLIKKILLPVPPLTEQIRVIEKTKEMMDLIEPLRSILLK